MAVKTSLPKKKKKKKGNMDRSAKRLCSLLLPRVSLRFDALHLALKMLSFDIDLAESKAEG
jgi:hypothetical protein